MENSYNARCPAVKRLLREAQELCEPTEEYYAHPVEDNLFEWHFTVRGPPDTDFEGGVYHGRIIMPAEYPMKPPNIIFFTPNGRFQTIKKICLSISGHHPESWQPSWSIRTALLAIIGFMPTPANGAIGSVDYSPEERAVLAKRSVDFVCSNCGRVGDLLKERTGANEDLQKEAKELSAQMAVTGKDISFKEKDESNTTKQEVDKAEAAQASETMTSATLSEDNLTLPPPNDLTTPGSGSSPHDGSNINDRQSMDFPVQPSSTPPNTAVQPSQNSRSPLSQTASQTSSQTSQTPSTHNSFSLIANNILLSAAIAVLFALVLRRLFLLNVDSTEEMEDILL